MADISVNARGKPWIKREIYQRAVLWLRQGGLCHWCGKPMLLVAGLADGHQLFRRRPMPENLCTLDHLDSRWVRERGHRVGEYRRVAACRTCNEKRAADEQASVPIEELHRRAQMGKTPRPVHVIVAVRREGQSSG